MSPSLQFIVSVGAWAQDHQALMLAFWGTIIVVLGGREIARFFARRPRL
jgi:hypothetical protein